MTTQQETTKLTEENRYNTDYDPSVFQVWCNGQKSSEGHDKAQTLFWCWVGVSYKATQLGFDTAMERDAFVSENETAHACEAPSSGDRDFSVRKNRGPYTAAISF